MNQQEYYNPNEDFIERMLRNPKNVLNLIMIAVNILVFLLVTLTGGSNDMENMIRWGAAYTPLIQAGETYRLFTSMFLHFGISHLFNNMLLLLFVGDYLEKTVGKPVYLAVYMLGGLAGKRTCDPFDCLLIMLVKLAKKIKKLAPALGQHQKSLRFHISAYAAADRDLVVDQIVGRHMKQCTEPINDFQRGTQHLAGKDLIQGPYRKAGTLGDL